jgi:conjugative transposon TraN protein
MKRLFYMLAATLAITHGAKAQAAYGTIVPVYIQPFPIEVSVNKTTNLIFRYRIRNVDRGSDDIIDSLCNDTALLVKANRANFDPTNLSVYTSDGRLFAFMVRYNPDPAHLNLLLEMALPENTMAARPDELILTDDVFGAYCQKVSKLPGLWSGHRERMEGISARLKGVYVHSNVLFFSLEFHNTAQLAYDVANTRFVIADSRKAKRTATQEVELKPLFVYGNTSQVPANSRQTVVFALPKFTLPNRKRLNIIVQEQQGGRNLELKFTNRTLVRAGTVKQ